MMKFWWICIVSLLLVTVGLGGLTYWGLRTPPPAASADPMEQDLQWLKLEFHPTPEQLQLIATRHREFRVVCDEHCRLVGQALARLRHLQQAQATPQEIAAAQATLVRTDQDCRSSLETHLRDVAKLLGPGKDERYLAIVLPRIHTFQHTGAPDLQLSLPAPDQCLSHGSCCPQ